MQASPHRTQQRDGADGTRVLTGLASLPGGRELLVLCGGNERSALVGGAVRDLTLGRAPREIDVVTAGAADELASSLARRSAMRATGRGSRGTSDSAPPPSNGTAGASTSRAGAPSPTRHRGRSRMSARAPSSRTCSGAISPSTRSRVTLGGEGAGEIAAAEHALEDLGAGRLRVLHERSFLDDPTRLLRMARYSARLGFAPEPATASLAQLAIEQGALQSVSSARIGAELRLALGEPGALAALAAMNDLGVLTAVGLVLDPERARAALDLLPADGRSDVLLLACLLPDAADTAASQQVAEMLDAMEFPAGDRDTAARAASGARELAQRMGDAARPSGLMGVVRTRAPEEIALAGASGGDAAHAAARRWLTSLRDVRLSITGDDLLAAGIPGGPEIGRRLELALQRRLDGEIAAGREAELAAALEGR